MAKKRKEWGFLDDDEVRAEVQRRIAECRDKKKRKLDLSSYDIKEIPPELADLTSLAELDLRDIDQKTLPDFLGNLTGLKTLRIGSNYSSTHERPAYIVPDTLANLSNLQTLYLGYNIPEIPSWLFGLKNLKALTICNDGIETIPQQVADLGKLEGLRIYGEKLKYLPESLGSLHRLWDITLDCPGLLELPEGFANLKNLKSITLANWNSAVIPDYFCDFQELVELIINMRSTFQGPTTPSLTLPKNIGKLKNLGLLTINYSGLKKIPASIGDTPLEYLKIYGGDFTALPESIGHISTLKKLEIACGKLTKVPDSVGNLSSLTSLTLQGRFKQLPESLGNLSSLEKLDIHAGDTLLALPDSLGNCKNLKKLSITGDKLDRLPDSICRLAALEELTLATFDLECLPVSMGELSELRELSIESEALTEIPESFRKLEKLKSLTIDGSKIKIAPPLLEKLLRIKSLDIQCGAEKHGLWGHKAHHKDLWQREFEKWRTVSDMHCIKMLGKYSVAKLEAILCDAPSRDNADNGEKKLIMDLFRARLRKLNWNFEWSKENIERIVTVSDMFLKCWEDGFNRAKKMIDLLYANCENKADFYDDYDVTIKLTPEILLLDKETGEYGYPFSGFYSVLMDHQPVEDDLVIRIREGNYNPETKDESGFWDGIHLNHDLSWNIEGFGDNDLEGRYICYAMHILYSHHEWAYEDIMKIKNIHVAVEISDGRFTPVF